jgi:hypothetical protein
MRRSPLRESFNAAALTVLAVALLALAACGMKPSPGPSISWTPGASPVPAISYPPQAGTTGGFIAGTEGWYFEPTVDVEVTALGWWDDGQDGLTQAHPVGIFDASDEKLLVESKVQPDGPLDGGFRWVPLEPPVVLEAGREYVMAAFGKWPFDPEVLNPEDATIAPELSYLRYRERWAEKETGWGYPHRKVGNTLLSANFKFRPLSVASPTP